MVSVEELIGNLLLRHNCVIVPTFGGFVAKRVPAVIDPDKGIMHPPGKALLFNRQLINNDGLLTAEFASQNSIDYTTAAGIINQLVDSWNDQLKTGARVAIDRVGFLYFDQEKNVCFEQDRFFNLLLESYGLGKVHFMPVEDAPVTLIEEDKLSKSVPKIIEHPALKARSNAWKYVAAACFLPIAFYSYWIPAKTNVLQSGMISAKDFNPFHKTTPGKYKAEKLDSEIQNLNLEDLKPNIKVSEKGTFEFDAGLKFPIELPEEMVTPQATIRPENELPCQLIVGCFGSDSNVENMLAQLHAQGIEGYVYDVSNGLKRVSAGGSSSNDELRNRQNELNTKGIKGWIFSTK
ncbi:MAG: SPOR domain-containing protein [Flavobacteriia bacterium]|jgi:hypothetical protein